MSRLGKVLFLLSGFSLLGFMVSRFLIGGFIPYLWIPLGLFLLFIIGAVIVDRQVYADFLGMKTTKHGMNMGAMIATMLLFLATINYLGVKNYKVWDFSQGSVNTLSDQSVKLLKSLDSELKITFFYKDGVEGIQQQRMLFQGLVRKYQDQSKYVVLDFVEVNKRPDLAESYGVNKGSGVVFLEYKGRKNRIEKIDEQEITGALVKVTREKDKYVYILTGHGEGSLDDQKEAYGLSALKTLLEGNRYIIKELMLAQSPQIPEDADVVILPGARQELTEGEIKVLTEYLVRGGSLVVAQDAGIKTGVEKIISPLGIELKNNYIVAVMQSPLGPVADPSSTPAPIFSPTSSITKVFGKNEFSVFRLPQAITLGKIPAGVSVDEIVRTSDQSYGFKDTKFKGESEKGPFTVVVHSHGKYPGTSAAQEFNLILIADADFIGNQFLYKNLNRDLMLNSMALLSKEENLISITPKEIKATEIKMTENDFYMFVYIMVIGLPLFLLSSGGVLWYRRKNA